MTWCGGSGEVDVQIRNFNLHVTSSVMEHVNLDLDIFQSKYYNLFSYFNSCKKYFENYTT